MFQLLAITSLFDMWYAIPLIIAVSLVYSATRYEETPAILAHACRTAVWVVGFMVVVFLFFYLFMSRQL
jgi:uncharacterized membrane protein